MNDLEATSGSRDLTLPIGEPPNRLPPCLSIEQMMERIEELRRWFPNALPTQEERLRSKVDVPFRLLD